MDACEGRRWLELIMQSALWSMQTCLKCFIGDVHENTASVMQQTGWVWKQDMVNEWMRITGLFLKSSNDSGASRRVINANAPAYILSKQVDMCIMLCSVLQPLTLMLY